MTGEHRNVSSGHLTVLAEKAHLVMQRAAELVVDLAAVHADPGGVLQVAEQDVAYAQGAEEILRYLAGERATPGVIRILRAMPPGKPWFPQDAALTPKED